MSKVRRERLSSFVMTIPSCCLMSGSGQRKPVFCLNSVHCPHLSRWHILFISGFDRNLCYFSNLVSISLSLGSLTLRVGTGWLQPLRSEQLLLYECLWGIGTARRMCRPSEWITCKHRLRKCGSQADSDAR